MLRFEDERVERVFWVKDYMLASALFNQGIATRQPVQVNPSYNTQYLFRDTLEIEQLIKDFWAGKIKIDSDEFFDQYRELIWQNGMFKQDILHVIS